jgi:predicted component of type VI protein secretion system
MNMAQRAYDTSRDRSSPGPSSSRHLVLEYRGHSYAVDKERFLVGRSKTQADLRLDDANVSRQHAAIEHVGSAWYIVDLGSTNGVQVAGERVSRRALSDGDVIVITTHEIRCTLR